MAELIKATGERSEIHPERGRKFKLEELQRYVGGYIERVQVEIDKKRLDMIVDEEGRLKNKPFNEDASEIANRVIVGDVVIAKKGEW